MFLVKLIITNIDYDERSQGQLAPPDFVMAVSSPATTNVINITWTELDGTERIKCILKPHL